MAVAFQKSLALLQIAIVARLLVPSDFGILALGLAFLLGVTSLTALGIEKHLVQRPEMPADFVRSAWSANILRNALVALISFVSASFYAQAIGEEAVESVLRLLAFAPLLLAFASPNQYLAQRDLNIRTLITFEVSMSILQFGCLVILAYLLRDVYALVLGQLAMSATKATLSWFWFGIPGLPSVNRKYFSEILSVGKHFLIIAVGTFVMTQADNLIVGSLLGTVALGYYALAYKASQFAVDLLNATVGRIVLPVFSRLQADARRLKSAFTEIWRLQIALLIPLAATIAVLAEDIILVLFGDKYSNAAKLLQFLATLTLGRGMSHLLGPFIIGTGGVQFASHIKAYEASLFVAAVWMATNYWGTQGAALSAGAVYTLSALARLIYVMRKLALGPRWLLSSTIGAIAATSAASLAAHSLQLSVNPFLDLAVAIATFALFYVASSLLFQRDLLPIIRNNWISLRGK